MSCSPLTLGRLQGSPSLLRWCGNHKDLPGAMLAHHDAVAQGVEISGSYMLGASLMEAYLKCEAIAEARALFFASPSLHSLFTWNLLIRSYGASSSSGGGEEAMAPQCFARMQGEGFVPDRYALVSLLSSCIGSEDLPGIRRIHACIAAKAPRGCDLIIGNALLHGYGKCGRMGDARVVFGAMAQHDSCSWDTFILAHANSKLCDEALRVFQRAKLQGLLPTRLTYMAIVEALGAARGSGAAASATLACIFGSDHRDDVAVATSVVNMLRRMGRGSEAWDVFRGMRERNSRTWNGILAASRPPTEASEPDLREPTLRGEAKRAADGAIHLYEQMLSEAALPSEATYIRMLSACACPESRNRGRRMHARVEASELISKPAVRNALVSMYSKCAGLREARSAFARMIEGRNVVSWTTLVVACVEHGQSMLAVAYFGQMLLEGILPDTVLLISIADAHARMRSPSRARRLHAFIRGSGLDSAAEGLRSSLCVMYGRCGSFEDASRALDRLGDDADVRAWTSLMSAYNQYGGRDEAVRIFGQMLQQSALPNAVTFFALLDACARRGSISEGKRLHARAASAGGATDARVESALVDMYAKCGSLEESSRVFHGASKRDIVLVTAMMASYAMNGDVRHALDLFRNACCRTSLKPDEVTFIHLLSMCSHAGLVDEGRALFSSMSRDHRIEPNVYHYNCMIDMLARAGRLKEAEDMIGKIPCPATASSHCLHLLGSCRRRFDV